MKETENYDQLLARFTKRTEQLEGKQFQLADSASVDYNEVESRLKRPVRHGNLDALDR